MPALNPNEELREVLANRRSQAPFRAALAAAVMLAGGPVVGWTTSLVWLAAYAGMLAIEYGLRSRTVSPKVVLAIIHAHCWVFGSYAVLEIRTNGVWGLVAGVSLIFGGLMFAGLSTGRSSRAFLAAAAPYLVYLAAAPVMALGLGASFKQVYLVATGCVLPLASGFLIWRSSCASLRAERTARAAAEDAAAAKSSFLAMMSHELRTPMNGVLGMAHALTATNLSAEQRKYVDLILRSGDGLMAVLKDVLDLSSIEGGRFEISPRATDLRAVLAQSCDIWARPAQEKNLQLDWVVGPGVPEALVVDPACLRQMLLNLLSNAVKFTPAGSIHVRADAAGARDDPAAPLELMLSVRDTGVGIEPEALDSVFDAFTQADNAVSRGHGGAGLGLAITRRLATLMGGEVRMTSALGSGSTCTIRLPVQAPAAPLSAGPGRMRAA